MNKQVRLTEGLLRKAVRSSINKVIREGIGDNGERDVNVFANLITDLHPEQAKEIAQELRWASMGGNFDFSSFVEYLYRHMEGDGYQREVDYDAETM